MNKEDINNKIQSMGYESITCEPMDFVGPSTIVSFITTEGISVCSVSIKRNNVASVIKIELLPLSMVNNDTVRQYSEVLVEASKFVDAINSENKS